MADNYYSNWSNFYSHEQVTKRREEETRRKKREDEVKRQRKEAEKKKLALKQQREEWLNESRENEKKAMEEFGVESSAEDAGQRNWYYTPSDESNSSTAAGKRPALQLERGFGPAGRNIKFTKAASPTPIFGPQAITAENLRSSLGGASKQTSEASPGAATHSSAPAPMQSQSAGVKLTRPF